MSPDSPGSDPDASSPGPDDVPGEDNPVEDTLCELRPLLRSSSEPSFALSLVDIGNFDPLLDEFRLDAQTPDVGILLDDFSTESFIDHEETSEAALLRLPDEGSVFPAVVPGLPVARHPSSPCPEDEDGCHSHEAARLKADIHAIETQRNDLGELIQANKTDANLTEEAKRTTKLLKPKPAEPKNDRKPAATTRSRSQMEAKKKSKKRAPYKCKCGNMKKDHICPLRVLFKSVEIQTAEEKSDRDREILVGNNYECCHLQADDTETSEPNDSTEDNHDQKNHSKDVKKQKSSTTPKSSNDEESLPETGQEPGHNMDDDADDGVAEELRRGIVVEEIETADADTAEDTQSANDKASDAGTTAKNDHEESAETPAKRKGDTDDTSTLAKKSKNDESPQPADSRESDSIGGPVEEPPQNDQETIAANMRLVLHVESDEEIVTVPV